MRLGDSRPRVAVSARSVPRQTILDHGDPRWNRIRRFRLDRAGSLIYRILEKASNHNDRASGPLHEAEADGLLCDEGGRSTMEHEGTRLAPRRVEG